MATQSYVMWKDAFSVGNENLDSQHRVMFGLLNDLYDTLQEGQSKKPINTLIEEACQYAKHHFETEEALMAKCSYPGLGEHKKAHEAYRKQVAQIQQGSKEDMAFELFLFLREWWLNHIRQMDSEYALCLKKLPGR